MKEGSANLGGKIKAHVLSKNVYIITGYRTPIGKFGKSLRSVPAVDLALVTAKHTINTVGVDPADIDFVVYGHVIRGGTGMDTARQVALRAGIPEYVDAMTVEMVCSSGMAAVITGSTYIESGAYNLVLAGGMESMSNAPYAITSATRWGVKLVYKGYLPVRDLMVNDGLYDPLNDMVMGEEADETAKEHGATRDILDWIGYESHRRAATAWEKGYEQRITVPVARNGKVLLDRDEGIRIDTSLEKMKSLKPAFSPDGLHTAGTSSQLSDGAASMLIGGEEVVGELGLKPRARILGWSYAGVNPRRFPYAPVLAVKALLDELGWKPEDVDYWENNEAFAVNSFLLNKYVGVPYDRMNVHGGAIAVGHPLGMSGARIILELINVLEIHGGKRGIAAICHGLGGASAIAIEKV